jgi:hypothetical protein
MEWGVQARMKVKDLEKDKEFSKEIFNNTSDNTEEA